MAIIDSAGAKPRLSGYDAIIIGAGFAGSVVARELAEERANVVVTDPKALDNARRDLADILGSGRIEFREDPYAAAAEADAVLVMTDWGLYPELDWARIHASMRQPALVFDTRNCLDAAALRRIGFKVLNIGR